MKPIQTLIIAAFALLAITAQAQDVAALLKATDKYRMSADNLQVETLINVVNADGTPDKERRYKAVSYTHLTLPTN